MPDRLSSGFAVQSLPQKYFVSQFGRNSFIDSLSRPTEGRLAIVTDAGRDAVDALCCQANSAKADGEVVWS